MHQIITKQRILGWNPLRNLLSHIKCNEFHISFHNQGKCSASFAHALTQYSISHHGPVRCVGLVQKSGLRNTTSQSKLIFQFSSPSLLQLLFLLLPNNILNLFIAILIECHKCHNPISHLEDLVNPFNNIFSPFQRCHVSNMLSKLFLRLSAKSQSGLAYLTVFTVYPVKATLE